MMKPKAVYGKSVLSKDGTKIVYDIYGSGPLLICVFGATCFREFIPVKSDVKIFAQHFTVVNYDRRGRGASTDNPEWSIEKEIDDIEALIDANGGRAVIYGHSSGAVLALEATMRLGGKVASTIIYDASYVSDDIERAEFKELGENVRGLIGQGNYARAIKVFLAGIGMPKFFIGLLPLFPGWSKMKGLAPTLAYDIALTSDTPPLDRLKSIATPVLVMAGGKNPPSILKVYKQLSSVIPGGTSVVLPRQNHMASAKVLLPEMTRFLKGR